MPVSQVSDFIITSSNFLSITNTHAGIGIANGTSAEFDIIIKSTSDFSWINTYFTHLGYWVGGIEHYIGNFMIDGDENKRLTLIDDFSKALIEPFTVKQDLFISSAREVEEIICQNRFDLTVKVTNNSGSLLTNDYKITAVLRSRTAQQFTITTTKV